MPRFAAIDVGSNALRLRVLEASVPDPTRPGEIARLEVASHRKSVRLGGEVFMSGKLSASKIGEACAALREFRAILDTQKVDAYRAVATSAVREANNAATLVERARREAGIDLEIIEGVEEARLVQLAVMRKLPLGERRALLADVGGGSTELSLLDHGKTTFSMSVPVGTVRLLETYLKGHKTLDASREKLAREGIVRALMEAQNQLPHGDFSVLVGTGGNIDTLSELCPMAKGFAGYPRAVDVTLMRAFYNKIGSMSEKDRRETYNLRPDRADTIVPAAAIFLELATVFDQPAIVAPGVGLAAGILEELVERHFNVWDRAGEEESVVAACLRLGQRFHFDEGHARTVMRFSAQLFDDLSPVHALGERERLLLRAAALLHDVGDYVRYDGHHKHSYYLISHSDIMGLTPDERAIVANVARYHRKSPPDTAHPNFRELSKEARSKVRALSAILRIADALDREHVGKIEGVRAAVDRASRTLTLFLRGSRDRELEEWTVFAKSELLRDVYDLGIAVAKGELPLEKAP